MTNIGKIVKEARLKAGFSQRKVAALLEVSPQMVNRIEQGIAKLSPDHHKIVCENLKIKPKAIEKAYLADEKAEYTKKVK